MRPRPLNQDSAVVRATGFADLSISAGQVFKQALEAPTVGNLLSQSYKTSNSLYNNATEEEKEEFREQQRQRDLRKSGLEAQLDIETDPIKREQFLSEIDQLYKEKETQRDYYSQKMIDDGRLITSEALNEEYGDFYTFEKPESREVAEMLVKNVREELVRNAILEKGLDGVAGYTALLGGALLAAATDPIELGAAFIPYFGQARRAATVARFGKIKGRTAIGAGEGLAGSLLTEPLYYGLSQQLQLDYSMGEALLNVGVGTLLGSGIGTIAGVTARRLDIKEIARDSGVPDDIFPEQQRISEADAVAETQRRNKNTYKNNGVFGGQRIGNVVLRQFVNDNEIDVSPVMPRYAKRPQTLVEFIKDRGGINDDKGQFRGELSKKGIKARTGYVTKKGSRVSYLSNKDSELDLVEATEIAFDGGYLGNNQVDEFLQRIDEDLNGDYTFSLADQEQADLWRKYHQGKNDFEKETEARNLIRQQVKDTTGRDVTDAEVAILADEINRTGVDLEDATKSIQVKLDDFQAQMLARNGQSIANDVGADVNSAERFDELLPQVQDEFEFDAELEQNEAIIRQYEENGDLDAEDLKELEEIRQIEEKAASYQELTRMAAICTARA
jgi:hypothetical protein